MSRRSDKGEGKGMGGSDIAMRNMELGKNANAWKASMRAARANQLGTTGIYEASKGERRYGGNVTGPMKSMQGPKKAMSPEHLAKKLKARRG